jgi:hypothetical protein
MPYPTQFPYDLLDASPDDTAEKLQQRFMQASRKRRDRVGDVRRAWDELRDTKARLSYDILLITGIATSADFSALTADFAQPEFMSGKVQRPALTLSLTDLGAAPDAPYQPVARQPMEIIESGQFTTPPGDLLKIAFDR